MLKPKPYGPMALDDYAQRVALALQYVVQADLDHRNQEVCFIPSLIVHAKAWGEPFFKPNMCLLHTLGLHLGLLMGCPLGSTFCIRTWPQTNRVALECVRYKIYP